MKWLDRQLAKLPESFRGIIKTAAQNLAAQGLILITAFLIGLGLINEVGDQTDAIEKQNALMQRQVKLHEAELEIWGVDVTKIK